jgi:light-regulated signal transduction histidine kinase (bacteriophytochrome)
VLEDYGSAIDERGRSDLRRVRAAAQHMDELIDSLLSLTRLGSHGIDLKHVDLTSLGARVIAELRDADPQREVEVVIEEGLAADTDATLAGVVIQNLLSNAWKFTTGRPAAHIWFGSAPQNGQTAFFVRDDGAGFDARYVDKLFAPFQRLHTGAEFPGAGIGLATVARVLDRLGGRYWAQGAVGEGATFWFTLQADEPAHAATGQE